MEEKIGMLIELVNQYEIEKEKSEGVNVDAYVLFKWKWVGEGYLNKGLTRFDETDHWEGDSLYGDTAVAYLISKSFGMIKWLVENDKIDLKKLYEKEIESGWDFDGPKTNSEDLSIEFANQYNTEIALMLLSISDTPIDDLISYLK